MNPIRKAQSIRSLHRALNRMHRIRRGVVFGSVERMGMTNYTATTQNSQGETL